MRKGKNIRSFPLYLVAGTLLLIGVVSFVKPTPIMVYNHSPSLPEGVYWLSSFHPDSYAMGDIVVIPTTTNAWPSGFAHHLNPGATLLKIIIAGPGDEACTTNGSLVINGEVWGHIYRTDSRGNPIPLIPFCDPVPDGHVLVGTHHERSFDSRYFGPISTQMIMGNAHPLLTF
ncbi:MAG: hypothetical protein GKS05_13320 [Nitrospirales bacterium]|nr:hypothetical protein [Nitrospirales bacterium]NKB82834.1 hypothetical protein [Nitrospirales bacterium]